ncbi:MAG: general secretion pathway protein GspK [Candidatus Omnitrophica bacterium]|nr:general secretion pathway protein GspK [Candidatus Omnitrophota bacterium]
MQIRPTDLRGHSIFQQAVNLKGSILYICLFIIFLLSTFAITISYGVRLKLALVKRLQDRDRLRFIAEAGIKRAIAEFKYLSSVSHISLKESILNSKGLFKDVSLGDETYSICYGCMDGEGKPKGEYLHYGLIDESRKINLNKADRHTLERLFKTVLGIDEIESQELAASVLDWRDGDSQLSIPLGSAEDSYYRYLQYPYEAKDAEFQILEELLLVKGMNQDNFEKLKDYITIYGDGKVNVNTASKTVLLSTGLDENIVEKIIEFRNGEDGIAGTEDDNIFDLPSNIVPRVSQIIPLSDAALARLTTIAERNLTTNSEYFMIPCIVKISGTNSFFRVICVIDRQGKVIRWQEL